MKLRNDLLLFVMFILFIGCTHRAFKKHEKKLNVLLNESKNNSLNNYVLIDTVRILSKDSMVGWYNFQIGGYFEGYIFKMGEKGKFRERKFYDVMSIDRILQLHGRYGRWHFNKDGVITFKYLLGFKRYGYIAYKYHQRTFLVPVRGINIFCNRIRERKTEIDSGYLRPLDSTAIIKAQY